MRVSLDLQTLEIAFLDHLQLSINALFNLGFVALLSHTVNSTKLDQTELITCRYSLCITTKKPLPLH